MFFGKEVKSVQFTVNDISSYAHDVQKARGIADDCYRGVSEWAEKIIAALGEIIEVGTHNLEVCETQIEACDQCKEVAESKINALNDLINQVEKNMHILDETISKVNEAYRKACEEETRIRNSTASNEQEEKSRSASLAAAHKAVKHYSDQLSKLRNKRSKLYNAKNELGGDISDLNKACSEVTYIRSQLEQERQRISRAVDNARDLQDKVNRSLDELRRAYRNDINGTLYDCEKASNTALSRARAVEDKMGELNGKSYSDYDVICVTDINALKNMSHRMADQLQDMTRRFSDIYKICNDNGEKLGDNIMASALTVMQSISEAEKLYLKQLSAYSVKLDAFSRSLDNYYNAKM